MEIIQQITSSVWGIAAAVVVLGLCIFFHEAGHFLAAKAASMRVDAFALGFGPKLVAWRRGETEYSVRVFPMGGFVAIAGMEPGEGEVERGFHSKPRWLGAATIAAGVVMNIVLAVLLYTLVTYTQGLPEPGATGTVIGGIYPNTPAADSGLRVGDQVIAADGNRLGLAVERVTPGSVAERLGIRAGDRLLQVGDQAVSAPTDLLARLLRGAEGSQRLVVAGAEATDTASAFRNLTLPPLKSMAAAIRSSEQAAASLQRSLGLTFAPMSQYDLVAYTNLRPDARLMLTVDRQGQELVIPVTTYSLERQVLRVDDKGRIVTPYALIGRIGLKLQAPTNPVSFRRACRIGAQASIQAVAVVIDSLQAMISGKIRATPGGPVSILAMSYESAKLGWGQVATFGAFLSANLAVLNLLPIPPLDGFVLLVLAFEALIRRRIDARAEYLVKVAGFLMLMSLLVVLTFNDVRNLILHGPP